jgi:hypothetical protein
MKSALSIPAIALVACGLILIGCQNPTATEPETPGVEQSVDLAAVTHIYEGVIPPFICGEEVVATMMTGKNHNSGAVKVANDNDFLYIAFEADPEFDIITSHLAVVRSLRDVPQSPAGEPLPGRFVLKRLNNKGAISHTYKIPLAALYVDPGRDCGSTRLFIVAHAVVKKKTDPDSEESVWASGKRFVFPGSWATFLFYKIQCCGAKLPPVLTTCEPSWAYGAQNFIDAGVSSDWGWFDYYNQGGTFTRDIIGGAGENDPAKGKVVGVMTVEITTGQRINTVTVSLDMNDGFTMNSAGIYFDMTAPTSSDPTTFSSTGVYVGDLGGAKTYTTTFQYSGNPAFYITGYSESCGPF